MAILRDGANIGISRGHCSNNHNNNSVDYGNMLVWSWSRQLASNEDQQKGQVGTGKEEIEAADETAGEANILSALSLLSRSGERGRKGGLAGCWLLAAGG